MTTMPTLNKAVSARVNRVRDTLDLAIDWMATEPKDAYMIITKAGKQLGATEGEIGFIIDSAAEIAGAEFHILDKKLESLIALRKKLDGA